MPVSVNKKAPDFTTTNQLGKEISLSDFKGKKIVLYFYPKDDTPTCTNEACNLRDNYNILLKQGYVVLGISPDDEKSHKKFIDKFNLPFDLLTDMDHSICKKYGVWGQKQLFGHKYMGVIRSTFLIDEKGKIVEIIDKVQSSKHTEQIMKIEKKREREVRN